MTPPPKPSLTWEQEFLTLIETEDKMISIQRIGQNSLTMMQQEHGWSCKGACEELTTIGLEAHQIIILCKGIKKVWLSILGTPCINCASIWNEEDQYKTVIASLQHGHPGLTNYVSTSFQYQKKSITPSYKIDPTHTTNVRMKLMTMCRKRGI